MTEMQARILVGLAGAIVVLLAVIAGVLLFGGDDEPVAAAPVTTATTSVRFTPLTTTTPPSTSMPTPTTVTTTTPTTTVPTTAPTTTTTAVTSTSAPAGTTTTAPGPCAFVDDLVGPLANHVYLDTDGIGSGVLFGDPPNHVIRILTCLLGEPDRDSGWGDSFSVFGTCPGSEVRGVTWGPLTVLFGDGNTGFAPDGTRHFFNWTYDSVGLPDTLELVFPETLVGLGSTVAEVHAAYPGAEFFDGEPEVGLPPSFSTFDGIYGTFTGTGDADTVRFLSGGPGCGE